MYTKNWRSNKVDKVNTAVTQRSAPKKYHINHYAYVLYCILFRVSSTSITVVNKYVIMAF